MAGRSDLRDAATLLAPAVERMITALDCPEADSALVALVRRQAQVIDGMPDAVAVSMLPNHTGQLVKALAELETRAAKRRRPAPRPNKITDLRKAAAAAQVQRMQRYGQR